MAPFLQDNLTVLLLVCMATAPLSVVSFAPQRVPSDTTSIRPRRPPVLPKSDPSNSVLSPIVLSASRTESPAPAHEDEKEKQGNDQDWTTSRHGGFLPNLRRQKSTKTPLIHEVVTMPEYKAIVVDEPDTLVVVRFYAPFCRACKAVEPIFRRMAEEYPEVKFVQVPLTKRNAFLHEGLGVSSFPFAHIYHPDAGLVEELKVSKKRVNHFQQVLDTYVQGLCVVPPDSHALP